MPELEHLLKAVFNDTDLPVEDIPRIELYQDQVLKLFTLSADKHNPSGKVLTKAMVHNYTKEGLIKPAAGKRYNRQLIMQIICVYILEQSLCIDDIKNLTRPADVDFEACYTRFLAYKKRIRNVVPSMLSEQFHSGLKDPVDRLSLCMALSEISVYMRRLCEGLVDYCDDTETVLTEGEDKNVY